MGDLIELPQAGEERPAHATLGASSSERWINCAGSVRLSEGKEDRPSVYKQEGSAAHEVAARALTTGRDPALWLGALIEVTDGDEKFMVEVTEEMTEAADVFVNYVRSVMAKPGERELFVETRIDLSKLNPPAPMYGRADAGIVVRVQGKTAIEVVDFKYGQGKVVEVKGNSQGRYYALGFTVAAEVKADLYKVTIVQPRAGHPDGPIRSETFTWDEMVAFKNELFAAATATQDPNAPLIPGDWCGFCKAKAVCPALKKLAEETARTEFSNLPVVAGDETAPPALPAPAELTPEELREVMEKAHIITAWITAVQSYVTTLTESGMDLGYKLVPKRGTRRWVDEDATAEWLEQHLGDAAYKRKLRSPYQSEQALKQINMNLPDEMWQTVSSGTNLVPNDDPREAVPPPLGAADEFEDYLPLVEAEYTPDTKNAIGDLSEGAVEPEWAVSCHRDDLRDLTVRAVNETDARRVARLRWDVGRLPNNTSVTNVTK